MQADESWFDGIRDRIAQSFALPAHELRIARQLRAEGHSDAEIVAEIHFRRTIEEGLLTGRVKGIAVSPQLQAAEEKVRRLEADLGTAIADRDGWKSRAEAEKAERLRERAQFEEQRLKGKERQTALKGIYLLGDLLNYDSERNNGAVAAILGALNDKDIEAKDDEAFRNLLLEANERKAGGYWKKR